MHIVRGNDRHYSCVADGEYAVINMELPGRCLPGFNVKATCRYSWSYTFGHGMTCGLGVIDANENKFVKYVCVKDFPEGVDVSAEAPYFPSGWGGQSWTTIIDIADYREWMSHVCGSGKDYAVEVWYNGVETICCVELEMPEIKHGVEPSKSKDKPVMQPEEPVSKPGVDDAIPRKILRR
jgi:hypothetical protein